MDQLFPDRSFGRLLILRSLLWTLLVGFFLLLGILYSREENIQIAVARARESYNKDVAYRIWATQRGGVYVPLDEKTPANPYLKHIPDRDIRGSNGKTYTLVNPAYMTRLVHEVGRDTV